MKMGFGVAIILSILGTISTKTKKNDDWFGDEAQLLQALLMGYQQATRPVSNASHTIVVKVNFALTQILNIDEKNQVLTTNVWFSQEWQDEKMQWDPDSYNNLRKIRIPPHLVWRPDIVLYNGVEDYGDKVYQNCLAMVENTGRVFWAPIANLRSTCKLDMTFFPFDDQVCHFKLGSWTYDGFQVDLTNMSDTVDLEQYTVNGGWDLIATRVRRNVVYYPCCPEPYPDVTYTIVLRRRTLYYIVNAVAPCLLLSGLSMLGFWLPPGTSEKVSLGLTILLAFYILTLSIADRIPETSEFIPLIGVYLLVIMILTSISVALCVFILHIHRLSEGPVRVPLWLHHLVSRYLSRMVGMTYIVKHREEQGLADLVALTSGLTRQTTNIGKPIRSASVHFENSTGKVVSQIEGQTVLRTSCTDNNTTDFTYHTPKTNYQNSSKLDLNHQKISCEGAQGGSSDIKPNKEVIQLVRMDDGDCFYTSKPINRESTEIDNDDIYSGIKESKALTIEQRHVIPATQSKANELKILSPKMPSRKSTGSVANTSDTDLSDSEIYPHPELLWHDIAEIIDRFFFWLCFFTVTTCTVSILVIVPLSKPDPLTLKG